MRRKLRTTRAIVALTICFAICLSGCDLTNSHSTDDGTATPTLTPTAPQNGESIPPASASTPKYIPTPASPPSDEPQSSDPAPAQFDSEPTPTTPAPTPEHPPAASDTNNGTEVRLIVSGQALTFNGQQPVLKDGEVFIPVYGVFEHLLGANDNDSALFTVKWDASAVTIRNSWNTVVIVEGEPTFTCNGATITPALPPQIINGTFMLPLKAIAEAIDATIKVDEAAGTVSMFYEGMIRIG